MGTRMDLRTSRWIGVVALSVLFLLVAFAGVSVVSRSASPPQPKAASGAYFDYLVVIVMENQDIGDIYGPLPYMTSLADSYSIATHDTAIVHPSEGNYLAMLGGLAGDCGNNGGATGGCMTGGADSSSDCSPSSSCTMGANLNLVDRLEGAGLTWKAYAEDLGTPCDGTDLYPGFGSVRHFPFYYFTDITGDASRCAKTFPTSEPTDDELVNSLGSTSTAANFMYLAPNDCNNMHSCSLDTGDAYLEALVPRILGSNVFQTQRAALLITFDEGSSTNYPTDYVYTVWAGPVAKRGYSSTTQYTTYSFLSTLEANWGLAPLQATDASAAPMSEFFTSVTPPAGPTARFAFSPSGPLVNEAITFDATSTTDANSSATLQARWDWNGDGTWDTSLSSSLTAQHAYASPGTYPVALEIVDSQALNDTVTHSVTVLITADTTPPATTQGLSGSSGNDGWYTGPVTVALSATDSGSGVASIYVRVDGGSWQTYSPTLVVSGEGSHTVDYYATDNAGNDEPAHTIFLEIDGQPPTFGAVSPTGAVTSTDVTVAWSSSDDASGIAHYEVSIDGGSFADVGTTRTLTAQWAVGSHAVVVKAFDVAGNSAETTITFQIQSNPSGFDPVQLVGPLAVLGLVLATRSLVRRRKGRRQRGARSHEEPEEDSEL